MKKLSIYIGVLLFISSCTKDITSLNENQVLPEEVPPAMLFANAQKELARYMASPNVNTNTLRLWSQHWTQSTYTDESNYELTERNINGEAFDELYSDVLRDLQDARMFLEGDAVLSNADKAAQGGMITVMEVYTYHILVDLFNDVPYSEAGMLLENLGPAYDEASGIYVDLVARLDEAIPQIQGGSSGDLGASDLYSVDWVQFANSLKLKLALRMGDFNATLGQEWASEAIAGGISSSSIGIIEFEENPPNTNPLWEDLVESGRTDFIASQTLADAMNAQSDPRRGYYFRALDSAGNVVGNPHGAGGTYSNHSQPGDMLENPTLGSFLMTAEEILFLQAEAAARGWTSGSVKDLYDQAIATSVESWTGMSLNDTIDTTFLSAIDYDAQITAGMTWKEIIGTQKWIAMYNHGFEAWSTWRLYDAPTMMNAAEAGTTPPLRFNYSVDEYSVNGTNASAANGGSDDVMDRVFWDVN